MNESEKILIRQARHLAAQRAAEYIEKKLREPGYHRRFKKKSKRRPTKENKISQTANNNENDSGLTSKAEPEQPDNLLIDVEISKSIKAKASEKIVAYRSTTQNTSITRIELDNTCECNLNGLNQYTYQSSHFNIIHSNLIER